MPPLTPCPVVPDLPLAAAAVEAAADLPLGVWLRGARRPLDLVVVCGRQSRTLFLDGDLGRLLGRCPSVLVRLGSEIAAVPTEALIRVRALRIVAGLPYLSTLEAIRILFPDALAGAVGLEIPLGQHSAEEVLAFCAAARTPVSSSRVVYGSVRAPRGG